MGESASIIDTSQINLQKIKAYNFQDKIKFRPPFRTFSNQSVEVKSRKLIASFELMQPHLERVQVSQQLYNDMEDAFDDRTKDIRLDSVLVDNEYSNLKIYLAHDGQREIALKLINFGSFNSHAFNDIIYEIYINDEIIKLKCAKLNSIISNYVIQTGLQVEGEEFPNTQVFQISLIATNLSEIIRYRRENKWYWTTEEFNQLANDLVLALLSLHRSNICHNDIRPCNVLFSIDSNCYQLGNFGNATKHEFKKARKFMSTSQVRSSANYSAPEFKSSTDVDLREADIYSLGITLLSAFFLCEPINQNCAPTLCQQFNRYPIMAVIQDMVAPAEKRANIQTIRMRVPQGQSSKRMRDLINSLKYKNAPKGINLINFKKILSDGYQKLGLWNDWKELHCEAFQLQDSSIDEFNKAGSLYQLAKIQSCRGDIQAASDNARKASKIYRELGYSSYDQGNINESLSLFTRATECSKYFEHGNDIDTVRNLQGLALIHAEKGQYEVSKPLISESSLIVVKAQGKQSVDYCKIRMSEAKIQTDFGQFASADRILHECLSIVSLKIKQNEEVGLKLKAEVLHEIGRNAMMQSSYEPDNQNILTSKAERYLFESMSINQKFTNNSTELVNNIESFGQIELRKQNYVSAKMHFQKALQLRTSSEASSSINSQKCTAETICNIAACESGMQSHEQALKSYNEGLDIFRRVYGSDHNKQSAMAIGNMSKVYFKLDNQNKAKQCLHIAAQILLDLLGSDDPDYLHFKYLEDSMI